MSENTEIAPIPGNTGITSLRVNIETTSTSESTEIASIIGNIGITSPLGNTETTPMSENTAIAHIYIYIYIYIHTRERPWTENIEYDLANTVITRYVCEAKGDQ